MAHNRNTPIPLSGGEEFANIELQNMQEEPILSTDVNEVKKRMQRAMDQSTIFASHPNDLRQASSKDDLEARMRAIRNALEGRRG